MEVVSLGGCRYEETADSVMKQVSLIHRALDIEISKEDCLAYCDAAGVGLGAPGGRAGADRELPGGLLRSGRAQSG